MNERIEKLARQVDAGYIPRYDMWQMDSETVQKFAELIVKECAQAFEAEVDTWKEMDPYQGSMKRKGTQAIKQHFGVEECQDDMVKS
jgi:hypothetical protein